MKTTTKIVIIAIFVLGNHVGTDDIGTQASKTDCTRLQKLLDQYAHILLLVSLKKTVSHWKSG